MDTGTAGLIAIAALVGGAGWLAMALTSATRRYSAAMERHTEVLEAAVAELRSMALAERRARHVLIASVVALALRRVHHWQQQNLMNLVTLGALPDHLTVLPDTAGQAVEYARYLPEPAAVALTGALDELRRCEEQFGIARRLLGKSEREFERAGERLRQRLLAAAGELRRAGQLIQAAGVEGEASGSRKPGPPGRPLLG